MAAAAKLAPGSAFRSGSLAERPRQPRPVKAPPYCGLGISRTGSARSAISADLIRARVSFAESDPRDVSRFSYYEGQVEKPAPFI